MKHFMKTAIMALLALSLIPTTAEAVIFEFTNISNNNAADALIGEAQLSVDVTDLGSDQVLFTFFNSGPAASSITDVYFDDGGLFSIASLINDIPNVEFSVLATPPNLPGKNNVIPSFETTAGFSADSDPPVQPKGVNPGESFGILFNLEGSNTFQNIIDDLDDLQTLRIGIHVQGYASGGSESFVNKDSMGNPPFVIPEPGTLLLLGSGLAGLGFFRMRKKKRPDRLES